MKTIKVSSRLTADEHETLVNYDNVTRVWIMDSTIAKHFNRALKQGWKPIRKYVYDDGQVCGMTLTAPEKAITIRNVEKKKMSEKQMNNLNGGKE